MIRILKESANEVGDLEVIKNLDGMTIDGIFESGKIDDDVSETPNGKFFGWGNRTILSADFFDRNDIFEQLRTLLHESYHAGNDKLKEKYENDAYNYAQKKLDELKNGINKRINKNKTDKNCEKGK